MISIFILILFIGIGYSLLADVLGISRRTTITKDVWSVHFVDNTIDDSSSSITECSDISTCANVSFNTLNDYYEFTVDLTNDGDIAAMAIAYDLY